MWLFVNSSQWRHNDMKFLSTLQMLRLLFLHGILPNCLTAADQMTFLFVIMLDGTIPFKNQVLLIELLVIANRYDS